MDDVPGEDPDRTDVAVGLRFQGCLIGTGPLLIQYGCSPLVRSEGGLVSSNHAQPERE
jgi:hypothetical protein